MPKNKNQRIEPVKYDPRLVEQEMKLDDVTKPFQPQHVLGKCPTTTMIKELSHQQKTKLVEAVRYDQVNDLLYRVGNTPRWLDRHWPEAGSALSLAAKHNSLSVASWLLEQGYGDRRQALHVAAANHYDMRLLLKSDPATFHTLLAGLKKLVMPYCDAMPAASLGHQIALLVLTQLGEDRIAIEKNAIAKCFDLYLTAKAIYQVLVSSPNDAALREDIHAFLQIRADVLRGDQHDYCFALTRANELCAQVVMVLHPAAESPADYLLADALTKGRTEPWLNTVMQTASLPESPLDYFRTAENDIHLYLPLVVSAIQNLIAAKTTLEDIWVGNDPRYFTRKQQDSEWKFFTAEIRTILTQRSPTLAMLVDYTERLAVHATENLTLVERLRRLRTALQVADASHTGREMEAGVSGYAGVAQFAEWWLAMSKTPEGCEKQRQINNVATADGTTLGSVLETVLDPAHVSERDGVVYCVKIKGNKLEGILTNEKAINKLNKIDNALTWTVSHATLQTWQTAIVAELATPPICIGRRNKLLELAVYANNLPDLMKGDLVQWQTVAAVTKSVTFFKSLAAAVLTIELVPHIMAIDAFETLHYLAFFLKLQPLATNPFMIPLLRLQARCLFDEKKLTERELQQLPFEAYALTDAELQYFFMQMLTKMVCENNALAVKHLLAMGAKLSNWRPYSDYPRTLQVIGLHLKLKLLNQITWVNTVVTGVHDDGVIVQRGYSYLLGEKISFSENRLTVVQDNYEILPSPLRAIAWENQHVTTAAYLDNVSEETLAPRILLQSKTAAEWGRTQAYLQAVDLTKLHHNFVVELLLHAEIHQQHDIVTQLLPLVTLTRLNRTDVQTFYFQAINGQAKKAIIVLKPAMQFITEEDITLACQDKRNVDVLLTNLYSLVTADKLPALKSAALRYFYESGYVNDAILLHAQGLVATEDELLLELDTSFDRDFVTRFYQRIGVGACSHGFLVRCLEQAIDSDKPALMQQLLAAGVSLTTATLQTLLTKALYSSVKTCVLLDVIVNCLHAPSLVAFYPLTVDHKLITFAVHVRLMQLARQRGMTVQELTSAALMPLVVSVDNQLESLHLLEHAAQTNDTALAQALLAMGVKPDESHVAEVVNSLVIAGKYQTVWHLAWQQGNARMAAWFDNAIGGAKPTVLFTVQQPAHLMATYLKTVQLELLDPGFLNEWYEAALVKGDLMVLNALQHHVAYQSNQIDSAWRAASAIPSLRHLLSRQRDPLAQQLFKQALLEKCLAGNVAEHLQRTSNQLGGLLYHANLVDAENTLLLNVATPTGWRLITTYYTDTLLMHCSEAYRDNLLQAIIHMQFTVGLDDKEIADKLFELAARILALTTQPTVFHLEAAMRFGNTALTEKFLQTDAALVCTEAAWTLCVDAKEWRTISCYLRLRPEAFAATRIDLTPALVSSVFAEENAPALLSHFVQAQTTVSVVLQVQQWLLELLIRRGVCPDLATLQQLHAKKLLLQQPEALLNCIPSAASWDFIINYFTVVGLDDCTKDYINRLFQVVLLQGDTHDHPTTPSFIALGVKPRWADIQFAIVLNKPLTLIQQLLAAVDATEEPTQDQFKWACEQQHPQLLEKLLVRMPAWCCTNAELQVMVAHAVSEKSWEAVMVYLKHRHATLTADRLQQITAMKQRQESVTALSENHHIVNNFNQTQLQTCFTQLLEDALTVHKANTTRQHPVLQTLRTVLHDVLADPAITPLYVIRIVLGCLQTEIQHDANREKSKWLSFHPYSKLGNVLKTTCDAFKAELISRGMQIQESQDMQQDYTAYQAFNTPKLS